MLLAGWKAAPGTAALLQIGISLRHREPFAAAVHEAFDKHTDVVRRVTLLEMLEPTGDASLIDPSLELLASSEPDSVRSAALQVLARFDDPRITQRLIAVHQSSQSAALNSQIRDVLLSRAASARAWISVVDRGDIATSVTSLDQIRRVALFADPELDILITKHWGKLQSATREETLAEVRRLNNDLRAGSGNAAVGQRVYKKHCAACHQLFGEGTKIGPDLTTANRQDRNYLLVSLVDPSSVIRKEYVSVVIQTSNGRVISGLPIARSEAAITLVDAKSDKLTIAATEIDEVHESPVSLMPDNLYRQLTPQELRDLFAYLQSKQQ